MTRYSEKYAQCLMEIKKLQSKIDSKVDPLSVSMIKFLIAKDLMIDWASFFIEESKPPI